MVAGGIPAVRTSEKRSKLPRLNMGYALKNPADALLNSAQLN